MSSDELFDEDRDKMSTTEVAKITGEIETGQDQEEELVDPFADDFEFEPWKDRHEPEDPVDWSTATFEDGLSQFIDPRSFEDQINPRMFKDDLPHKGPVFSVDKRMAADLNIIDNRQRVDEICKQMGYSNTSEQSFVLEVVMNDFSVVYLPFRPIEGTGGGMLSDTLKTLVPEVKKWDAIINGDDPSEVEDEWELDLDTEYPDYDDLMEVDSLSFSDLLEVTDHKVRDLDISSDTSEEDSGEPDYSWQDEW